MMSWTRRRLVAPTATILVLIGVLGFGQPPSFAVDGPSQDPAAAQDARTIRQEFGLDTSASRMEEAARAPQRSDAPLPIPLTEPERSELVRRDAVSVGLGSLMEDGSNGSFEELGTVDLDSKTGRATIGVTSDSPAVRERIRAALPAGTPYDLKSATTSWKRLDSLLQAITADMSKLKDSGISVQQVTHDWAAGTVVAYVYDEPANAARSSLASRYGDEGLVVRQASSEALAGATWSRHALNGPAIGGQNIATYNYGTGTGATCTLTGGARNPSTGALWLITAGHCNHPNSAWWMESVSGDYLGANPVSAPWDAWAVGGSTSCDCLAIDNSDPGRLNNYTLDAFNNLQGETSNATPSMYTPSQRICASSAGVTNGVRCGTMTGQTNYNLCLEPNTANPNLCNKSVPIYDGVFTTLAVCHGDSGSPVTKGATWVGIVSSGVSVPPVSGCGTQMIFTKTIYLQTQYGLQLLTWDI
jgi:hypothetical protein